MSNEVYITGLSKFLPNQPVLNDEMEDYLGMIDGKPSKARRIVLRNNGIKTRYYAFDKGGVPTHTNAQMTAEAVNALFDGQFDKNKLELLACGTTSPDQFLPSHTVMVHGCLDMPAVELASFAGSCCTGIQALKYAYLSVLSGNSSNAICAGSESTGRWMRARHFESETQHIAATLETSPILAFEKEFLRWMLSDGAGAARLENKPSGNQCLKIEWIEIRSYANLIETCMYYGGEKEADGSLKGWADFEPHQWLEQSIFSLKQDTRILGENIVPIGSQFMHDVMKKHNLDIESIDYFLPHLSSEFFRGKIMEDFKKNNINIPAEKWFTNLSTVGNIGSAAFLVMLEELFNSGKLKKGEKLLLMVPESARFSYAFMLVTVC